MSRPPLIPQEDRPTKEGRTHGKGPTPEVQPVINSLTDEASRNKPQTVPRLTYRLNDLATALGVSRRTIERERSAGRFPPPDLKIGKSPLWMRETIVRWIAEGGAK